MVFSKNLVKSESSGRLQVLWRRFIHFFVRSYDVVDGGKHDKKLWERCTIFVCNLFTRNSRIAPAIVKLPALDLQYEYDMSHDHRGIAMIFNHEFFDKNEKRDGTNSDRNRLNISLERFGFDVQIFDDFSSDKIEKELRTGLYITSIFSS